MIFLENSWLTDSLLVGAQEIGVCFAFVEFEDMSGVHNAIKVS